MSKKVEEEFLTLSKKDVELSYRVFKKLNEKGRFKLTFSFIKEEYPECNREVFTREDKRKLRDLLNNRYNMTKNRMGRLNPYIFLTKTNPKTGEKDYQMIEEIVSVRKIKYPGEKKEEKHFCIINDKDCFTAYKISSMDI